MTISDRTVELVAGALADLAKQRALQAEREHQIIERLRRDLGKQRKPQVAERVEQVEQVEEEGLLSRDELAQEPGVTPLWIDAHTGPRNDSRPAGPLPYVLVPSPRGGRKLRRFRLEAVKKWMGKLDREVGKQRRPKLTTEEVRDAVIGRTEPFRAVDIAEALGMAHPQPVRAHLRKLANRGVIESLGKLPTEGANAEHWRYVPAATGKPGKHPTRNGKSDLSHMGGVETAPSGAQFKQSSDPQVNALTREALRSGATLSRKGKHPKLTLPDGNTLPVPTTPGDRRTLKNYRASLRRAGLVA